MPGPGTDSEIQRLGISKANRRSPTGGVEEINAREAAKKRSRVKGKKLGAGPSGPSGEL